MKLFFFCDSNFRPLRDRLVSSQRGEFELQEDFIEDLGVMQNRAGGGVPTYLYKAQKIKNALDSVEEGEVFVFSDVDIQFLGSVRGIVEETIADVDLVLQREFDDIGVNIGFIAMRNVAATRAFWKHVHSEIERIRGLDQRVVNNTLYSGLARQQFGLHWARFPPEVWASSMAGSGKLPEKLVLHHANFTIERSKSFDPSLKLEQMDMVSSYVSGDREGLLHWVELVASDRSMADYRDRHFGARRPGPEWAELPPGHVARPGGFREKRGAAASGIAGGAAGGAAGASEAPAPPATTPEEPVS
uniref:Nucleotide-diphospho-sugar transferase domain-containing protein n=1 Tax=Alexandrium monilatum TaxID=311494 RepID=A0A7S4UGE4_9DINO|mmetsp:Transcript_75500/g.225068  ORF Transcript_75500/g.225068 Transcript_75500/m.225068 type:complete len:302 (+) Transcript_75500:66-971(+)